jgi:hypothetical protein
MAADAKTAANERSDRSDVRVRDASDDVVSTRSRARSPLDDARRIADAAGAREDARAAKALLGATTGPASARGRRASGGSERFRAAGRRGVT